MIPKWKYNISELQISFSEKFERRLLYCLDVHPSEFIIDLCIKEFNTY